MILIIINTATVSHLSIGRVNTTCPVVVVGLIINHARETRSNAKKESEREREKESERERKRAREREREMNSFEERIVDCVSVSLCVSRFLSFLQITHNCCKVELTYT